jgi:hypothetical protein
MKLALSFAVLVPWTAPAGPALAARSGFQHGRRGVIAARFAKPRGSG